MNAPRRISGPLAALCSAAIVIGVLVPPTPAGAASTQEPTLSAWGTSRIDGVMTTGEWDRAARIDFRLTIPAYDGGGELTASLYVMNDALNLYLAVKAPGVYGAFRPWFDFDNDNDGLWPEEGDDSLLVYYDGSQRGPAPLRDQFWTTHCPEFGATRACGRDDTYAGEGYPVPGTIDGAAAGLSSSADSSTVVEMSHPLDSSDDARDFSLHGGSVVGVRLYLEVSTAADPACGAPECYAVTYAPAQSMAHIRVASSPAAALVISASPRLVDQHGATTLTVEVAPLGAFRQVTLQKKTALDEDWVAVRTLTTGSNGRATARYVPTSNTLFRASFAGAADLSAATSPPVVVRVRYVVTLTPKTRAGSSAVARGTWRTYTGTMRPIVAGQRMVFFIFRWVDGAWVAQTTATRTADASGRATLAWRWSKSGRWSIQVRAEQDAMYGNAWSNRERVTVP